MQNFRNPSFVGGIGIAVDQAYGDAVFRLVGSYFSEIRPAATMIVCKLLNDDMKVEIEVTAQLA